MRTLKLNSPYAEDVKVWQEKVLGFTGKDVDGDFGLHTQKATRQWQRDNGVFVDGEVGPLTWGKAGYESKEKVVVSPQAIKTDNLAFQVAMNAPGSMTEAERQYVLAVARGEGRYGLGWATPNPQTIAKSKEYGLTGYEGKGSNNWGAVQGKASGGSFPHVDYGFKDGIWKSYVANYRKYLTPEEGFADMAKIILGGGPVRKTQGSELIRKAINSGNLKQAVLEQHANKYFELDPQKYFDAVSKNYEALTQSTNWKPFFGEKTLVDAIIKKPGLVSIVLTICIVGIVSIFSYGRLHEKQHSDKII